MLLPPIQGPSFLVSTSAVARWTKWWENNRSDSLGNQPNFPLTFEVEVDGTKDYAAVRLSMVFAFEEHDAMKPVHLILSPQKITNVRVERIQRADSVIRAALWPGMRKVSIPDYSTVVLHISKGPPALVLGPAHGMTPQTESTELALNRFKWMAESRTYKIYMRREAFTEDQLNTLCDVLNGEAYELDPDELTNPSYEGYKIINGRRDKEFDMDDSPISSSDESVSSHYTPPLSPYRVPHGCSRLRVTNKRKRPITDQASRSDDLDPSIADHLEQLEERLTQRMNAQWEEKVQRMLAESKDAILAEVDARLNARLAEIRADIANKPYEPREGGAADLARELELNIEARLPSLKDELREVVCDDVKARLISALGCGSSAS